MNRIFVGNIAFSSSEAELGSWFESHGFAVESTEIIIDRMTGKSRGFGFVQLSDSWNADRAVRSLNGKMFSGRPLTVSLAEPFKSNRKSETEIPSRAVSY